MPKVLRLSGICAVLSLCLLAGCSTNPVTGESQINFYSLRQQEAIGQENYLPVRQSQGGDYETDPSLTAYVSEVGQRLAAVADVQMDYEFVVLNNGVPNAWALPGGKIAVNRGLLSELTNEAELAAVLGHEIVHAAAEHGAQAMSRGNLLQGALLVTSVAAREEEYADWIVGGATLGAQLVTQRYGREAEREADYYGIRYMVRAGYDPRAAVSLQETFVRLSEGNNPGWLEGLFASHPPSQERVENNRELVNELLPELEGRDLETGEARYRQATAFLRENQPAYELFEEAQRAVADDDLEIAYRNLEEAVKLVPREARFHGLQGDILVYQRRYRAAIDKYDEAIALDDTYFDYYLGRGVAHARLDQDNLARQDLERSNSLLPTAIAQNELGKLSLEAGNLNVAKQHFELAMQAGGQVGQEARRAYLSLDVPANPAQYVSAQPFLDSGGRLHVRIGNQTSLDLHDINVQVAARQPGGGQRRILRIDRLPANNAVDLSSGFSFPAGTALSGDLVEIQVLAASP